jgi:hypothetical protein
VFRVQDLGYKGSGVQGFKGSSSCPRVQGFIVMFQVSRETRGFKGSRVGRAVGR